MPKLLMTEVVLTELTPIAPTILVPGVHSPVPGVYFSKLGMVVADSYDLSYEDWEKAGDSLAVRDLESRMAFMWSWGDWLTYGHQTYGEKYAQAINRSGRAYKTLANYKWVASKTPRYLRGIPKLTQRHYENVAKIKDIPLRLKLLVEASVHKWTATGDLPREIEKEINLLTSGNAAPVPASTPSLQNDLAPENNSKSIPRDDLLERDQPGPPPATQADQISDLEYQGHQLEKQSAEWFIRYGWLENQVVQAVARLRLLDNSFSLEAAVRECIDQTITFLEALPGQEITGAIASAITSYEKGDTTGLINAMDLLKDMLRLNDE